MTEIHITDPTPFEEDIIIEKSLRPSKFDEFIGQKTCRKFEIIY